MTENVERLETLISWCIQKWRGLGMIAKNYWIGFLDGKISDQPVDKEGYLSLPCQIISGFCWRKLVSASVKNNWGGPFNQTGSKLISLNPGIVISLKAKDRHRKTS